MRADRLLSILLLLQAHGQLTGRELARRLEVSERTLHRDMDALSAAGVPVFALRGAHGGWQLDENWRTQVPGLEEAELRALLMAQPRVIGDPRLAAAAERALGKLMAALPASLREQAASIRQRLHVDSTGWRGATEDLAMLPMVQDAVSRDRKLKIRYRKMEDVRGDRGATERVVDPLGLVAKGNTWYLVANTPAGLRTFRVSRMEEATVLDKPSHRPPDFHLAEYWRSSTEKFQESRPYYDAVLRLDSKAVQWMKMWRMVSPGQKDLASDSEGWSTLRVHFHHEQEARFVALGLGARVNVLEPEDLRAWVAKEISAMARRVTTDNTRG